MMKVRGIRWPFAYLFLLLCLFAMKAFGATTTPASGNPETTLVPHQDPGDQREFQNLYNSVRNPQISTGTAQNFTIVNGSVTTRLTVPRGTLPTDTAQFSQIHLMQLPVMGTSVAPKTTLATTYQATSLTASITPTSAASKILIFASGTMTNPPADDGYATFLRGSTNVVGGTAGLATNISSVRQQVTLMYMDSPATTSSTAYTVAIRTVSGAATTAWGDDAASIQVIFLMEVQ